VKRRIAKILLAVRDRKKKPAEAGWTRAASGYWGSGGTLASIYKRAQSPWFHGVPKKGRQPANLQRIPNMWYVFDPAIILLRERAVVRPGARIAVRTPGRPNEKEPPAFAYMALALNKWAA
jgi:hypothetical protein